MKRLQYILVLLGFLWIMPIQALATTLWYNGDYDGLTNTSNYYSEVAADKSFMIYDDFKVSAGGWTVNSVWSNTMMTDYFLLLADAQNEPINEVFWEIRTGDMATGGTLIAGGITAATMFETGITFSDYKEYTLSVTGLDVTLSEGIYWLTVAPSVYWRQGWSGESPLISGTAGLNSIGSPAGNNGDAFTGDTVAFSQWPSGGDLDYSMGISGTGDIVGGTAATPVPAPILLLATGLTGLAGFRNRWLKKK